MSAPDQLAPGAPARRWPRLRHFGLRLGIVLSLLFLLIGFISVYAQAGSFNLGDLRGVRISNLAVALILAGIPIKIVSERLGHSSTQLTMDLYGHLLPEHQQPAADLMERYFQPHEHNSSTDTNDKAPD